MIERLSKSPPLLAAAFLVSALLGAGLFALIQRAVPGANPDKARIEAMVHDYILDHGEILNEAVYRMQEREIVKRQAQMDAAPAFVAAHRAMIAEPYQGAEQGNPKGDVTVAAYLDYNCGYCRASLPAIAELVRRDPNVRIVYREYPVLTPESETAARWALAAAEQGKFLPFHQSLYAAGRVDTDTIAKAAVAAGVDTDAGAKVVKQPRVTQEIEKNRTVAGKLGSASATPFWVVGNHVIAGLVDYDRLAEAVAAARKGK